MTGIDWAVLALTLGVIAGYGVWRGRGSTNVEGFLLADRSLRWSTVALAIMATQASAITFTSTPGQGYVDGLRFLQFYFGLPLAMVILSVTAVPIFHRLGVYTAYEYLELRFDPRMRVTGTILFLLSRGLSAGMTIYAPALVLSIMLGMDIHWTAMIIGGTVILYTTTGGVKAVNRTDVLQLMIILGGMIAAFVVAIRLLPDGIGFTDALEMAGNAGKMKAVDYSFDLQNRYNIWSGIIGGMFVALAYFGTDQSQVQRYLTGASVTHSRVALLFNGLAKIPMQFFIMLLGVLVYVVFLFHTPPLLFNPILADDLRSGPGGETFLSLEEKHSALAGARRDTLLQSVALPAVEGEGPANARTLWLREAQQRMDSLRSVAHGLAERTHPGEDTGDVNYIFLTYVRTFLPAGLVGLLFACIFAASMSSSSGELSALATTTVVDIYRRFARPAASERHYLIASRIGMAFWGMYGIAFSFYASRLGSLIETVNILGSLFYGVMLGIFLLAFYAPRVMGRAVFVGVILGEIAVLACFFWSDLAWLWYNVVGCGIVVGVAHVLTRFETRRHPGAA